MDSSDNIKSHPIGIFLSGIAFGATATIAIIEYGGREIISESKYDQLQQAASELGEMKKEALGKVEKIPTGEVSRANGNAEKNLPSSPEQLAMEQTLKELQKKIEDYEKERALTSQELKDLKTSRQAVEETQKLLEQRVADEKRERETVRHVSRLVNRTGRTISFEEEVTAGVWRPATLRPDYGTVYTSKNKRTGIRLDPRNPNGKDFTVYRLWSTQITGRAPTEDEKEKAPKNILSIDQSGTIQINAGE